MLSFLNYLKISNEKKIAATIIVISMFVAAFINLLFCLTLNLVILTALNWLYRRRLGLLNQVSCKDLVESCLR